MFPKHTLLSVITLTALVLAAPAAWAGVVTADLSITKTDSAASSIPGTMVTYTIVGSNAGPADVMGGTVADAFPAILTGCTWTCVASAGSSCTAAGAVDINDAVNLLNAGTVTYTATCGIDPSATGVLSNTATISSALTDPNMADNSATDMNTLIPMADLVISSVLTPNPVTTGQVFTVDVTVTNNGPSDATSVTVTSTFPPGAIFNSTTGCAEDPNGVPTCTLGTIPAGQMDMFTILATAPAAAGNGSLTLVAASPVADPAPGGETEVIPIAFNVEIPTVSEWGLMLLALMLGGAALWRMRR